MIYRKYYCPLAAFIATTLTHVLMSISAFPRKVILLCIKISKSDEGRTALLKKGKLKSNDADIWSCVPYNETFILNL